MCTGGRYSSIRILDSCYGLWYLFNSLLLQAVSFEIIIFNRCVRKNNKPFCLIFSVIEGVIYTRTREIDFNMTAIAQNVYNFQKIEMPTMVKVNQENCV